MNALDRPPSLQSTHTAAAPARVPEQHSVARLRATYRLQLTKEFGFDEAAALAPYLAALGISHVYCSPYLQAAAGSTHGYDVVDPHRVSDELGGAAGHARFCEALRCNGLRQVLDIVPNHMAIETEANRWWWDVLENGPSSRYAAYFDIDWDPIDDRFRGVVLLPCLGDQYGKVLEAGELRIERRGERFVVRYHEHAFPVAPRFLEEILATAAQRARCETLAFVAGAFGMLPAARARDRDSVERRHRDKEVLRRLLADLIASDTEVAAAIDAVISELNAASGRLHDLLERQNYRLAYWRMAGRDLGYRRFFDIATLIGLRAEDPVVFADTHALPLRWLEDGTLDGVRVDHIDGLRDPKEYLERLRAAAPAAWIVVEKILEPGECMPADWPDDGTTGYEYLNRAGGLFIDPAGEPALTELYAELTAETTDYESVVRASKLLVLRELLGSELRRLAGLLIEVCERYPRHRDHTRAEAEEVLRETIACFPVYRTYVRAEAGDASATDVERIESTIARAKEHRPDLAADLFDLLGDLLCLRVRGSLESDLVMRFQQTTGPAMAKGVEDTALYRFNRLLCLNEVGGEARCFGISPERFHRDCAEAQLSRPRTLLASSTHDTKRSEDVRARLALLSEIPERWGAAVRRWFDHNERHRCGDYPDRNIEYHLYQTLVGVWPIDAERIVAYVIKAAREAKVHTSWIRPEPEYESGLEKFARAIMADADFVEQLESFVAPLVAPGRVNSLAQTLLKLTAPGVPDIYRGSELWDLALVDPDNRRPVDWELRQRLLAGLEDATVEDVVRRDDEGSPKLWLIRQVLELRRERPEAFSHDSSYEPLIPAGERQQHVVAFLRGRTVATVVPRLVVGLGSDWGDTTIALPASRWRNQLGGELFDAQRPLCLADLLAKFPVALLARVPE